MWGAVVEIGTDLGPVGSAQTGTTGTTLRVLASNFVPIKELAVTDMKLEHQI
jgi:hypothetical protein